MNSGQLGFGFRGAAAQRLIPLLDRRDAHFTVYPEFVVNLARPPVNGRSDIAILDNQGQGYAPLCVVEAKRGRESPCGALTEGILSAAALGLHHNRPFVHGIATNLQRWTFFRVEEEGVYVSQHVDFDFDDGVPVRAHLEHVICWIYALSEDLVEHL